MRVTLAVKERKKPYLPIEAEAIVPKNFLDPHAPHSVWKGNKELPLEEVFTVTVEGEASAPDDVEIIIRGDSSKIKRVGEYMDGGRIRIEGDIGMHCGNFMSAGTIEIDGNAGEWLGREMIGGAIICHGNAGDFCGSGYRGERRGMRGGSIEVWGSAGDFAAETLTGGTVTIHGDAGDLSGAEMHGGILVIMGNTSRVCGNMNGGTCFVYGTVAEMLPTFRKEGPVTIGGVQFTKFTGDVANRGKGTLFIRDYQYMD
jgi:formylmethanofuran dehydrogenase subunit C